MKTGFDYPFKVPGQYSRYERYSCGLDRDLRRMNVIEADDRASLIRFNSTYIEMIDRWYTIRGGIDTIFMATIAPGIFIVMLYAFFAHIMPVLIVDNNYIADVFLVVFFGVVSWLVFFVAKPLLSREFFSFTHFPIRFNRKTRMIHVFRHNGRNGVLSVPWDQVYFHIGKGEVNRDLTDIRGHVMDGDNVIDTFAVGHFFGRDEQPVRQIWKFIVVYMEQGPQALPKDMVIGTSTSRSWANCFLWAKSYCDIFLPIPLINWVAVALVTCMRWLVMQSCKEPVWPAEIEATSAIEPNDPHQWAEPRFTGEFAKDDKVWAAMLARAKRRDKQEN
ncbi:DUF6708 domain-containing protein [Burkholderia ubonensis]|uniref:DUF6708 domain-containing protein n=1 Tax=Burkholderia ubonensis TaxID=101571 RepID=UPI000A915CA4|nr:DUF6708 domain-containing protein [Burkholderia ubonensis]